VSGGIDGVVAGICEPVEQVAAAREQSDLGIRPGMGASARFPWMRR
jgi:hypothetical protein